MNKKTCNLIKKYIELRSELKGELLQKAINSAKKSYLNTPKDRRFKIKEEMRIFLMEHE